MRKGDICTIVEVCAFISLTANPRAASCQEGGTPARDHSCPGPTWHRHCPLPTGGKRATGEEAGGTAPLRTSRSRPSRVLRRSRLHNPKGAGQNLSQTMLRHLTVGLTVGSVVMLRYQTQPCIAGRASPFLPPTPRPPSTLRCFSSFRRTRLRPPEKARGVGASRESRSFLPLLPPNVAPPATLENALLELLVAATKTLHKGAKPEGRTKIK